MYKANFFQLYKKQIIIWLVIALVMVFALKLGIDQKIVVFVSVVLGLLTQFFASLGAIVAMVPFIGPLIVKVFAIPFFWLLNALNFFIGVIAIRRGYSREVMKSRVLTVALLVGIVMGYILGHLLPLR